MVATSEGLLALAVSVKLFPELWPFGDLPAQHYQVIMADPPWDFATYSEKGDGRSASQHYEVMSLEDIKRLPVLDLAAPDCVLFLWATAPMLRQGLGVLDAWGFEYKTYLPWVKLTKDGSRPTIGTGYIFRNCQEPILVATRGAPKRKSRSERDVIMSPRRGHSRKPDEAYSKVERVFDGPYLELFSRCDRPAWDVWGREVHKFSDQGEQA